MVNFLNWIIKKYQTYMLQDIYCLDADGALFDAALLSAVAALSYCKSCMLSHLVLSMVHSNACSMANSNSLDNSLAHNPTLH